MRPWRIIGFGKVLLALALITGMCRTFDVEEFTTAYAHWPQSETPTMASRFASWDSAHYLTLSQNGYFAGSNSCAFYPLWPAMIRLFGFYMVKNPLAAGMVLANGLSLLGFWLFFKMVERRYGPNIARDAVILMLAFPGALFFSFPYSEALYMVLLMLFFGGLELQRYSWTAVAGFLLPLARPVGVFTVVPLAWYLVERRSIASPVSTVRVPARTLPVKSLRPAFQRQLQEESSEIGELSEPGVCEVMAGSSPRNSLQIPSHKMRDIPSNVFRSPVQNPAFNEGEVGEQPTHLTTGGDKLLVPVGVWSWLLLACPVLGYAAYFGLINVWTGNPFEGFAAQKHYPNAPSMANMVNCSGFINALLNIHSFDGMTDSVLDRFFFLLFISCIPLIYRLNKVWFFYVLPAGLVPALTSWFMSYRRYVMVLFPMFVVLAQLLARTKARWLFWYYVALLAVLQAWAVIRFTNFEWAG